MPDEPSAASSAPDPFEQRTRFGSFEILRNADGGQALLGKGAFGRTYKARHVFLERTVALKIINDRFLSDAKARERFLGEARAAAKLSHPHIAQILDFGETDGILYYAMEYCSGGDLADYVKRNGPLSVVQAVQIGLQVAGALQCAHAASFIHRDLKPSNLMLASPDGPIVTKLIDFGLVISKPAEDAPEIDPDDMPTIEQRFIGTPLFASPEQLLVQALDPRSDFFSLGMTLWFLVLGAPPDPGNASAIVAARLKPDSYADRLPRKLPQSFQTVLARLLEKRPENRFANAQQLVAALGKCAAGLGLPTAPVSMYGAAPSEPEVEAGPAQPAALEKIDAPVEECFTLQGQRGGSATGADYEATSLADQGTVWLHFLKPALVQHEKTLAKLQRQLGVLQHRNLPGLLRVQALRAHTDRTIVLLEAPTGTDLLSASKAAGPARLAEARPLLQTIATAVDTLAAAGLPSPDLDPHRVLLALPAGGPVGGAAFSAASVQLVPQFLARAEVAAIEGAAAQPEEPGWHFAALIYRLLSARNLPAPPIQSPADCLAVPGLSEEGNRLLAQALSRNLVHATCSELLADLLIAEGLMGAAVTRTFGTSGSAGVHPSTQGLTVTATAAPAPAPRSAPEPDPPTLGPADQTTQFGTRVGLPTPPRGEAAPVPPPLPPRRRLGPLVEITVLLLLVVLAGGGLWYFLQPAGEKSWSFFSKSGVVLLQGDVPDHATAQLGGKSGKVQREGDGWKVSFDAGTPLPAALVVEAAGYEPQRIELASPADLDRPHEVTFTRQTGTLVFLGREGADYDHAALRMTAQLPEEQGFVPLDRNPRGIELASNGEIRLPTGIYQLALKGANERSVRPRVFGSLPIKAGERTEFTLPRPFIGHYSGELTPSVGDAKSGEPKRVELAIEPGLTGWISESAGGEARRAQLIDGRIDVDGVLTIRAQFSLADNDAGFDLELTLKRREDGAMDATASEIQEENPAIERRLKRQPFPKGAFSASGTLRGK